MRGKRCHSVVVGVKMGGRGAHVFVRSLAAGTSRDVPPHLLSHCGAFGVGFRGFPVVVTRKRMDGGLKVGPPNLADLFAET